MSFSPNINKQAQEIIFSYKLQKTIHPTLMFSGTIVAQSEIQKHLGIFLDSKLDFKEHVQNVFNKVSKKIGLLSTLQRILPRPPFITIYKSFIRPHLDYGGIIYEQAYNFPVTIVNRPRNGYDTVGNIKVFFINSFKQLEVANKVDYVTN